MNATQIISEIQRLPLTGQIEVIEFAYRLDAQRMLSGDELGVLTQRMVEATDPAEKLRLREELTRGFYGGKPDAENSPSQPSERAAPAPLRPR